MTDPLEITANLGYYIVHFPCEAEQRLKKSAEHKHFEIASN